LVNRWLTVAARVPHHWPGDDDDNDNNDVSKSKTSLLDFTSQYLRSEITYIKSENIFLYKLNPSYILNLLKI